MGSCWPDINGLLLVHRKPTHDELSELGEDTERQHCAVMRGLRHIWIAGAFAMLSLASLEGVYPRIERKGSDVVFPKPRVHHRVGLHLKQRKWSLGEAGIAVHFGVGVAPATSQWVAVSSPL